MGLDNGLILRNPKVEQIPSYIISRFDFDETLDVCYWRKCWGIRKAILNVLDPQGVMSDEYEFRVEAEDVPAIKKALKPFFDSVYWKENGDSVWEYEEYKDVLLQDWVNLTWLEKYLKNNPDAVCFFYDSY